MITDAIEKINANVKDDYSTARDLIQDTYFKFAYGMAAVIAMAVYPFIFQSQGVVFNSPNGPLYIALSTIPMAVVLSVAWGFRVRNDRKEFANFKTSKREYLNKMTPAFTAAAEQAGMNQIVKVDADSKTPRLILCDA